MSADPSYLDLLLIGVGMAALMVWLCVIVAYLSKRPDDPAQRVVSELAENRQEIDDIYDEAEAEMQRIAPRWQDGWKL